MNLPELIEPAAPCRYTGSAWALTRIWWRNWLLGVLTLGIYGLWGQVHTRRYLWPHIEVAGMPLHWTGSFADQRSLSSTLGRVLVAAVFLRTVLAVIGSHTSMFPVALSMASMPHVLGYGLGFFIDPLTDLKSRQYQLAHTTLSGVAFGHDGKSEAYLSLYLKHALLAAVTLGYKYADLAVATRRYLVDHTRLGTTVAEYRGRAEDVRRMYIVGALASVLTLGAYLPWHIARLRNYHTNQVHMGPHRLVSNQEGSSLSNLWAGNILAIVCTLGLAWAWARTRSIRYQLNHLKVVGDLTTATFVPGPKQPTEGLVDFLSFAGGQVFGA